MKFNQIQDEVSKSIDALAGARIETHLPPGSIPTMTSGRSSTRKSLNMPAVTTTEPLPPTSTTSTINQSGTFAMKVFWKIISEDDALKAVDKVGIEELQLPVNTIQEIERALRESAKFLPPSARNFREWDVGLLERYEE